MKNLNLLGLKVKDRVTGSVGIVTSVSYDLYGCIQAVVSPYVDNDGKVGESRWYNTKRLTVINSVPVLETPSFVEESKPAGGQDLPSQNRY